MGSCKYCGEDAGWLRGKHGACQRKHNEGWGRMVAIAAESARAASFDVEFLRERLRAVGDQAFVPADRVDAAIAAGWGDAVSASLADGVLTRQEESRLREFRDEFALRGEAIAKGEARLADAVRDRLALQAKETARGGKAGGSPEELSALLAESGLPLRDQRALLVGGFQAAVEEILEDRMLSVDEEGAILRYVSYFKFTQAEREANGSYHNLAKGAILREVVEGIVPTRMRSEGGTPFNLMKSEKLVWMIDDVDYYETRVRRIRQGTSHGLSIRVARGLYYRPGTFRSEAIEHEETIRADTGTLGITSKHVYFHGERKRFRVRYNKVVSFEPYSDGFGLMRDAQSAKPQGFRTGDGWFVYNLVVNLAQMHE